MKKIQAALPDETREVLKSILELLKDRGLSFADCISVFGVNVKSNGIAKIAKDHYQVDGEIEIDDITVLSPGEDGTYVLAWTFVNKELFQSDKIAGTDSVSEITCSECSTTKDLVSTCCGSFCPIHLAKHLDHCQTCAGDFQ